jgi:hypothetical protein
VCSSSATTPEHVIMFCSWCSTNWSKACTRCWSQDFGFATTLASPAIVECLLARCPPQWTVPAPHPDSEQEVHEFCHLESLKNFLPTCVWLSHCRPGTDVVRPTRAHFDVSSSVKWTYLDMWGVGDMGGMGAPVGWVVWLGSGADWTRALESLS